MSKGDSITQGPVHLTCAACRVIDRADGVEDGKVWNPEHFVTPSSRDLFSLMRRVQNRTADSITATAGSMRFVYIHIIWFGVWIAVNVGLAGFDHEFDKFPFGLLTMIVSLEAIFLSTFVMISQNRQAARSDLRSQIDFENNIRGEVWSVHIGEALGLDVDHVEGVVRQAIEGAQMAMRNASLATKAPKKEPSSKRT
ncbi:MAG TPA: DUF1003 domain-containing protein [Ilumatobacteraceae bacterium]